MSKRLDSRRIYERWAAGESMVDIAYERNVMLFVIERVLRRRLTRKRALAAKEKR